MINPLRSRPSFLPFEAQADDGLAGNGHGDGWSRANPTAWPANRQLYDLPSSPLSALPRQRPSASLRWLRRVDWITMRFGAQFSYPCDSGGEQVLVSCLLARPQRLL